MATWVRVHAPVRVLDAGGWTDTWFAGVGRVCNLAVEDGVSVEARRIGRGGVGAIDLLVPTYRDRYAYVADTAPWRHPLLEAAIAREHVPGDHLQVRVSSEVPAGSSVGTSAAVVVALIVAMRALRGERWEPGEVARRAHEVETKDVELESGVQDHIAAAQGGANRITIDRYPDARVESLAVDADLWADLGQRLITVYLGVPHASSAVHRQVIAALEEGDRKVDPLQPLRDAADRAAAALVIGDMPAYGQAMIDNTAAQAALHPALVSRPARAIIELAQAHGAVGWKVNGAGGDGGSVTIIGPDEPGPLIAALPPDVDVLRLRPAVHGVAVTELE
jgi:D-glycero-alpha-D-manno-heptose-7-phosphate kinase